MYIEMAMAATAPEAVTRLDKLLKSAPARGRTITLESGIAAAESRLRAALETAGILEYRAALTGSASAAEEYASALADVDRACINAWTVHAYAHELNVNARERRRDEAMNRIAELRGYVRGDTGGQQQQQQQRSVADAVAESRRRYDELTHDVPVPEAALELPEGSAHILNVPVASASASAAPPDAKKGTQDKQDKKNPIERRLRRRMSAMRS